MSFRDWFALYVEIAAVGAAVYFGLRFALDEHKREIIAAIQKTDGGKEGDHEGR